MTLKNFLIELITVFNISIMIIPCLNATAQDNLADQKHTFKNGRLRSIDGFEIKFSNLSIDKDSVIYSKMNSNLNKKMHLDNVIRVEVQKGSHALEFGAGLAISGLLGSLIGVEQGESSSGGKLESSKKRNLILGFTAGSGLLGLLIGSNYKKYEIVYTNPKYGLHLNRFPIDIACSDKLLLVRLNYHF